MNNPMIEIANVLGDLYLQRANNQVETWKSEKEIEKRKLELVPEEGWQGKNAEAREIEAQRVYSQDEAMIALTGILECLNAEKALLDGRITGMETERRALEWHVRCGLVEALTGKEIQFELPGGDVLYSAFDDVQQDQLDDALELVANDATEFLMSEEFPFVPEPETPPVVLVEEDLPF